MAAEPSAFASRWRQLSGLPGKLIRFVAVAVAVYVLLYVADFFDLFHLNLFGAHRALSYAPVLFLTFLLVPAGKKAPRDRVPWYDAILAFVSLAPCLYVFFFYWPLFGRAEPAALEVALAVIMFVASLEAARRTLGLPLAILALFFLIYPLFGEYFPGFLHTKNYPFPALAFYLYATPQGIFGIVAEIFMTIIVTYLLFASFLRVTEAGSFILKLGLSAVGRFSGGAGKAAVIATSLFGTMSGIAVANVVTTGSFTIPLMKNTGYRPHFAAAVEATSATGGVIMPPVMGAVAFVMADIMQVSYWSIVVAAAIPAVLYYVAIFSQVHFEAVRTGLHGLPPSQLPSFWKTIKEGWHYLIPVAVLVYFLGVLGYSPAKAGLFAIIAVFAVSFFKKETWMRPRRLLQALEEGIYSLLQIAPAAAAIGIVMGSVIFTGLGARLSAGLVDLSHGYLIILLLLAAITPYILGMGLDVLTIYVILSIFVAPAMINLGVIPMAAHLFLIYWAVTSFLTPPVCVSVYAACAIAGSELWSTGFQAMRLGIVAFLVPFIFVYQPALLLIGSATEVALAGLTATVGVISLAGALEGYFLKEAIWIDRVALGLGGVLLIIPGWQTDIAGVICVAAVIIRQLLPRIRLYLAKRHNQLIEGDRKSDDS